MTIPLWTPSEAKKVESLIARFMKRRGHTSWHELHAWSLAEPEAFWSDVWNFSGVIGEKGAKPWIADPHAMPGARFFPEGRLNYAENLLRDGGAEEALVCWAEDRVKLRVTRDELRGDAGRFQRWLLAAGINAGDRVAAMMPNIPQTMAAFLGCSALGGVWSSCSPDFGEQGVLDRFGQIGPRVLVACDGYVWAAKHSTSRPNLKRSSPSFRLSSASSSCPGSARQTKPHENSLPQSRALASRP